MKDEKAMIKRVAFLLCFVLFFCQQIVFSEELELPLRERRRIESRAIDTIQTIVALWKMKRFDEIYEYGDRTSRQEMSKEMFISRMEGVRALASSSRGETIRDIEVEIVSPGRTYLKAQLGFRGPRAYGISADPEFVTKSLS